MMRMENNGEFTYQILRVPIFAVGLGDIRGGESWMMITLSWFPQGMNHISGCVPVTKEMSPVLVLGMLEKKATFHMGLTPWVMSLS
jgi:hypothetical protein